MTDKYADFPIGERIRVYRRKLGMQQAALAHQIQRSERWLVEVEAGRTKNLGIQDVFRIARVLKVDVATLTDNAFNIPVANGDAEPAEAATGRETLYVEHDDAQLTYSNGLYRPVQRRRLVNAGKEPITRFLVRIHVDRYPGDPERSNRLYREHPLTWDELDFTATCEGEPMTRTVKLDRDALKELYLRFESPDGRHFPLYPGKSTWIEYGYTVGEDKWGSWYQRAVRWPTRRLTVRLRFPLAVDPVVWGTETTMAGESLPFRTPIERHEEGDEAVFDWATDDPPLHARYRLAWRFERHAADP